MESVRHSKEKAYVTLEMDERKDAEESRGRIEANTRLEEQLEDDFDHHFWLKVGFKDN